MEDVRDDDHPGWRPGGPFWGALNRMLRAQSPFQKEMDPNDAEFTQKFLRDGCRVLVIGAGGLGCELLKNVALSGFRDIDVIDLDTIDVTNLNRQFLFRPKDVGKPKALVAAEFVNSRVPAVRVKPHYANIMDFDRDFYRSFNLVIAGLDSIDARRWLNSVLVDLVAVGDDGTPDVSTVVPLIDGGTEGFQGQARVILPRISACFECTVGLFPPARTFPLCTIANTPRLPEHCIEYANVVLWPKENPFGPDAKLDVDDPEHISWLYHEAEKRAAEFGIEGVTYRLTQGVAKNIIPAIASTNAIVAAACANEALKLATYIASSMNNYVMYNGTMGVYTFTYENERRPDCAVCGKPAPKHIAMGKDQHLADLVDEIASDPEIRSKMPFLRTDGGKTLFATKPKALHDATVGNLQRPLRELIGNGDNVITLTDSALVFPRTLVLELR